MKLSGYPMDIMSQINRRRLRFWLWVAFMVWALIIANRQDDDAEGAVSQFQRPVKTHTLLK